MYFLFLDESGTAFPTFSAWKNRKQDNVGLLVVSALGVPEAQLPVIDEWFNGIKTNFLGGPTPSSSAAYEIKGSLLYSLRRGESPRQWLPQNRKKYTNLQERVWGGLSPSQLEALEESTFDLLRRVSPTIWTVCVKQDRIYRKYGPKTWNPYYWALTYLQQRAAADVQRKHGVYQLGAFVIDETKNLENPWQFDAFLRVREAVNQTTAWPTSFARYLVNVPLFGCSHLHQPLQLSDVVAHATWKHIIGDDTLGWYPRILPFMARHFSTGLVADAGLTFIQ